MCLRPQDFNVVPEETVRVAREAFPKGNPYLTLRDELGVIYEDSLGFFLMRLSRRVIMARVITRTGEAASSLDARTGVH